MSTKLVTVVVVCFFLIVSGTASAQVDLRGFHIGPSTGEVVGAIVGAAVVIGVVVYLVVPKQSTLEGCVVSGGTGELRLTTASDKNEYQLIVGSFTLKPGERFRLKGKKHKNKSGRQFTVKKVIRDQGVCQAQPPASQ
jgi:hypothetical protein